MRALLPRVAVVLALALHGRALALPASAAAGEAIFRRGVLPSGAPLEGLRAGAVVAGAAAACSACHRRSGLGGREGSSLVPPITARYLYRPMTKDGGDGTLPWVEGMRGERAPYTAALLARAIRDGVDSEGHALGVLMPRYPLDDADLTSLVAYLETLDRPRVPGVTGSTLHFATIVTPDADPVKRAGMLEVMRQFLEDRNARQMEAGPVMRVSDRGARFRGEFRVNRRWELHVWELTGPAASWGAQLERHLAAQPVFAVVSGLGASRWGPVHAFCERAELPCLFPNVEAPPETADRDFYSVYFSRGVGLEADLLAGSLLRAAGTASRPRVVQVYRAGDSGAAGAAELSAALRARGARVEDRALSPQAPAAAVRAAVRDAAGGSALVLWLRGPDVAALPAAPPPGVEVYLSGLLAGLERAPLPPAWRERAHLAYPVDLPDRRRVRMDLALGWMRARRIPLVSEQVQVDTYLALGLVSETLKHLADSFVREYLVERLEDGLAHRILTGYYPRLALATGQRFASKGGYLVHLGADGRLVVDQGWSTP